MEKKASAEKAVREIRRKTRTIATERCPVWSMMCSVDAPLLSFG